MTKQRTFKTRVRQRMARTGERYSTARMHLLDQHDQPARAGLAAGVTSVGGSQSDIAAARNLLTNAGVAGPDGDSLSEAMAFGLAGGIGFLYGVFEYNEGPTMTIVARNRSTPDPFLAPLFSAAGTSVVVQTTSGPATAQKRVAEHLAAERPMLCTVGSGLLPYLGLAAEEAAAAPHVIGVIGHDGEDLLIDDRAPSPIPVPRSTFAAAHGACRKAKHRTITVTGAVDDHDWPDALNQAVGRATAGFDTPPVPQFAANVGIAGLTKWSRLLTNPGDNKSWARVFDAGPRAALGLSRLYDCITNAYTSPLAGRPLFVDFLAETQQVVDGDGIAGAVELFTASGRRWAALVELILAVDADVARCAEISDQRTAALDDQPVPAAMAALEDEKRQLIAASSLSAKVVSDLYPALGAVVGEIADLERTGLSELAGVSK